MQNSQRHTFFRFWLVSTLVLLIGTGPILRPDRDAAKYLRFQHTGIDQLEIETSQLVAHIRGLQSKQITTDQIKSTLLSNGTVTDDLLTEVIEFVAGLKEKVDAKERLTRFATIALLLPLIILEVGAALIWARRRSKVWTKLTKAAHLMVLLLAIY